MKRHSKVAGWCSFIPLIAPICLSTAQATGNLVGSRGGSDFLYFDLQGCNRDKFAILPDYDANREAINDRLATMFKNGQRRLRTAIPLPENLIGNTPGAALNPGYKKNIKGLLSAIKRNGFEEIEIGLGSVGDPPFKWSEWHEDWYVRRWSIIVELRPLLIASGLHYYVDLLNEGIPADNQPMLLRYTQRLWTDYTKSFGKKDTVGFSIITTIQQDRFTQIPLVYGNNPPEVFDLHIYDNPYQSFVNAHGRLKALGYTNIPWIIGEAYYNDQSEANDIARAIQETGQRVLFLLEWPLRRVNAACDAVDVVPLDFGEYMKRGF